MNFFQTSFLQALLLNLFISNLLHSFSCLVLAYADDIKLYNWICTVDEPIMIQVNLDRLVAWGHHVSASKCNIVSYSRTTSSLIFSYFMKDFFLQRKSVLVDLG